MHRAALVVALLVLAGCQAPGIPAGSESAGPGDATEIDGGNAVAPPDPASDRLGWENGYWYNESIAVTPEDGLNASERAAVVSRAMARVERVRGLEFRADVPVRVISRAAYRNRSGGNYSRALRRFDNAKFEALFLVGESNGSIETQEETLGQSVLGFYSPSRDAIVIVAGSETPTLDGEATLAHELVHALQDQHFGIGNGSARTRDAVQGRKGLIEGDASLTERRYVQRCRATWDCLEPAGSAGTTGEGGGGSAGHFGVQFMLYFPYSDGSEFVTQLHDRGGWAAVDDAYDDVPDGSTEVIYPERYSEWEPAEVTLRDRSGEAWERVRPPGRPDYAVPGQSAIVAAFANTLTDGYNRSAVVRPTDVINYRANGTVAASDPFDYDVPAAAGWAGGRMHVFHRGDELAYVWRTRWESERDARQFARAWRALVAHWGGDRVGDGWVVDDGPFEDAFAVRQSGRTVTVVNAPERSALSEVHDA